ncbi:Crp/Fnr family transcriptional regulator [Acidovorax sp. SUPP3434]|uniref:Crp/Fnr family transcriptional regulator n=1 Tax=Acidovorax sp. SUPP3434 TaxID=2920880 RepID=UPI0023DE65B9|nr:Crp/Fnr family transcriptional regulator [Acidovorax sp. SUPP3434]GKS99279.1 Crp/Fnr family transcriptional regulator [Acidovorax sp. SUPP3434]
MLSLRTRPHGATATEEGAPLPPCHTCAGRSHCLLGRAPREVQMAGRVVERRFRKGETLARQGQSAPVLQILKVGTVLLHRRGAEGIDRPVGLAGCGHALGTTALFAAPAELSGTALGEGRLCEVSAEALRSPRHGAAASGWLEALSRENARAQAQLADWSGLLRMRGATARLAGALLLLADLQRSTLVRLPTQAMLAALLATTRETVARGLAHIALTGGLVRHDRWHCAIVRPRLAALARGMAEPVSGPVAGAAWRPGAAVVGQADAAAPPPQPSFSRARTSAASACAPLP